MNTIRMMSFRNNRVPVVGGAFALVLLMGGCARNGSLIQTQRAPISPSQPALASVDQDTELGWIWADLLPEPIETTQNPARNDAPGPALAAGDWLAWQCALAGGYFEIEPDVFAAMISNN